MLAYQIRAGQQIASLELVQRDTVPLAANDVRVRVHAVSLNYRDLMIAQGRFRLGNDPIVPCSDGAGEVVEVGTDVKRFRVGDRVAASFFPNWIYGPQTEQNTAIALGAAFGGMLAEEVVKHEEAVVSVPDHLNYVEAATLPCAGVAAWNALFVEGRARPGDSVLLLGTGGVSIWALQLAKAAGMRAIITSSNNEKLARARSLGATATINYQSTPEWQDEVLKLTGGHGVDLVLEVGGQGTLARSISSARRGGTIAIIGGVSGFGGEVDPVVLLNSSKRLSGILVGSRSMFEDLNKFLAATGMHPVVDRIFSFDAARDAYQYLTSASHFGKVVIEVRNRHG